MAEPKAKSLQQRFGFMDNDLKAPAHDEIMLWLDKNAVSIIRSLGLWRPIWDSDKLAKQREQAKEAINRARASQKLNKFLPSEIEEWFLYVNAGTVPPKPNILETAKVKWEVVVKKQDYRSEFIIGFVDLVVYFNDHSLGFDNVQWDPLPGPGYYKLIDGILPKWGISSRERAVYFEVKSAIPSLGELIRQINVYREYVGGSFVVVSPDDKFSEPLKSQDIYFYKYSL